MSQNSKVRLDQLLLDRGLVPSRTKAKDLIVAGEVTVAGQTLNRPGVLVDRGEEIGVGRPTWDRFVSRAGAKLDGALNRLNRDVTNQKVLDLGTSTGGFVHCLFERGVGAVVGLEVGHGQTHPQVLSDSRLTLFEGVNVKEIKSQWPEASNHLGTFDGLTADLSFISLTKVMHHWADCLRPGGWTLALVKPQFEVGRERLNKRGVVVDPKLILEVEENITKTISSVGFSVIDFFPSEIVGKDGNQEYFIYAQRN